MNGHGVYTGTCILLLMVIIVHFILNDQEIGFNRAEMATQNGKSSTGKARNPANCKSPYIAQCGQPKVYMDLQTAVEDRASKDKEILIAGFIDGGYFDLALNLHVTSIAKNAICNALFIMIDKKWLEKSQEYDMPVYLHTQNFANNDVGTFRSTAFNEKSQLKLLLTHEILQMGFKVLLSDVDFFYRSNPFPAITCGDDCDLAVQDNDIKNRVTINTGFIYAKPTKPSLEFYSKVIKMSSNFTKDDQTVFNEVWRSKKVPNLKIVLLSKDHFCVGRVQETENCVVFHANFHKGIESKKMKLKQSHMIAQPKDFKELCLNATAIA